MLSSRRPSRQVLTHPLNRINSNEHLDKFLESIGMHESENSWFRKACLVSLSRSPYFDFSPNSFKAPFIDMKICSLDTPHFHYQPNAKRLIFDSFFAWDPTGEPRTIFEARMRREFETSLSRYALKTETAAKQQQKTLAYRPRNLSKWIIPTDAVRFIRYQVLKESYEEMARSLQLHGDDTYAQTIGKGVKRFAAFIGVKLREGARGGRPRKD